MIVTIVVPFLTHTGGIQVAAEYARALEERGHRARIYAPFLPYRFGDRLTRLAGLRRWLGDARLNARRRARVRWRYEGRAHPVEVHLVPWIAAPFLPPADAILATAWPTAYSVARLPRSRGAGLYLIQHHETWSGSAERVEGSYRLPLRRVAIASWLAQLLDELDAPVTATITNGVDTEFFTPSPRGRRRSPAVPPTVLMQYHHLPWKGLSDGFAAWEIVRARVPGARLVLFGATAPPSLPPDATFHLRPARAAIRDLYRTCDVFVSPSWAEGCQLPPMEAMASGCAVVATNVGGIPDYGVAGQTVRVVEPHDPAGVADAVVALLTDAPARERLAAAGHAHIQRYSWDGAAAAMERVMYDALKEVSQ